MEDMDQLTINDVVETDSNVISAFQKISQDQRNPIYYR